VGAASMMKRALLGRPIATAEELQERLPKKYALPVFASDAISSTAYATEEILLALVLAGVAAVTLSIYVSDRRRCASGLCRPFLSTDGQGLP